MYSIYWLIISGDGGGGSLGAGPGKNDPKALCTVCLPPSHHSIHVASSEHPLFYGSFAAEFSLLPLSIGNTVEEGARWGTEEGGFGHTLSISVLCPCLQLRHITSHGRGKFELPVQPWHPLSCCRKHWGTQETLMTALPGVGF